MRFLLSKIHDKISSLFQTLAPVIAFSETVFIDQPQHPLLLLLQRLLPLLQQRLLPLLQQRLQPQQPALVVVRQYRWQTIS